MDSFEMPASAFAADKHDTEKRLKELEFRVRRLEDILYQLVAKPPKDAT